MAKLRLTPPRLEILREMSDGVLHGGCESYPPLKWAHENGLVEKVEMRMSTMWRITGAGTTAYQVATRALSPNPRTQEPR